MQTVRHKMFGVGEVIGREDKENGTYITVRFASGKEMKFAIPDSFEIGLMSAEGSLKDEVDKAIEEKNARTLEKLKTMSAPTAVSKSVGTSGGYGKKQPQPVAIQGSIEAAFEDYLIKAGYKEETDSGNPSTVFSYINAVKKVLEEEGISWHTLKNDIADIVTVYDEGGKKELIGAKSNKTVINALKRFEEFVNP